MSRKDETIFFSVCTVRLASEDIFLRVNNMIIVYIYIYITINQKDSFDVITTPVKRLKVLVSFWLHQVVRETSATLLGHRILKTFL